MASVCKTLPLWRATPSDQPNSLGWDCVVLLPCHSMLKRRTNMPPGSTTLLDELSSRRHPNISILFSEQWWLISILTLKGRETRGCILQCVISILSPHQFYLHGRVGEDQAMKYSRVYDWCVKSDCWSRCETLMKG